MPTYFKHCRLCLFLSLFFLTNPTAICSENSTTVSLAIREKPLYVTCCDFDGNGLKDIIAADKHNITIFRQNLNLSFKTYTKRSEDAIVALNSYRPSKSKKESILCLGINKLFYFSLNSEDKIMGPIDIKLPENTPIFIEKQKNIKNFSFVVDLNNDGLDDIAIPSEEGLLFIWQTTPEVFKPAIVKLEDIPINTFLNIQPWPKVEENSKNPTDGLSFFPTYTKKQNYWLQDYNKDGLLDIVVLTKGLHADVVTILLQEQGERFQKPKTIELQKRDCDELRLVDLNNDGFSDILETRVEYPLEGNTSFLPLIVTKPYLAKNLFEFNTAPQNSLKSIFLPGLDNVIDLDSDGDYEILIAASPLKLGSKESIIKIAMNKEIIFSLGYFPIDKSKKNYKKYIEFDKQFSIILPSLSEIDNFKQFIKFEDADGDGISDILLLKKPSLLEIDLLERRDNRLRVKRSTATPLPCPVSYIETIDINADGKKELLLLDPSGKKIYALYWK